MDLLLARLAGYREGSDKGENPMNKAILLSATAVVAVLTGGAPVAAQPPLHTPDTVLWNQNSNFGGTLDSQNFTSGGCVSTSHSATAADDFVVPQGQTWHITEVDVTGVYLNGSGPASCAVVTFYTNNRKGKPGRVHRRPFALDCGGGPNFHCVLPKGVKLPSGTWWVSVTPDCSFVDGCGQWGWTENTVVHGYGAVTGEGGGHWTRVKPLTDLAFELIGKSS